MVSLAPPLEARPTARESAWARTGAPWIAGLVAFAVIAFAPQVLNDGDTWWHLATGEWILSNGQAPHSDVFSYTFAGKPWHTHEWLSEVLMALAFHAAGWGGVLTLYALAAGTAVVLVTRRLARNLEPLHLALALALLFACAAPSLLARPHLLALPLLVLWTDQLLVARAADRAPPLALALVMIPWANLHGGHLLGLALIAPFALEAVLAAGERRWAVLRDWGLFGVASLACALVNPFGVLGLTYPIQVMAMRGLPAIGEWRAADFGRPGPLELVLLATLFALLSRGVRLAPVRLLVLLGLLHMTLQHVRHQFELAFLGALLLADALAQASQSAPAPDRGESAPPARAAWACVAAAALIVLRIAIPAPRGDALASPVTALTHVPPALAAQPVFNSYSFGGYLIWRGVRPFIDGRGDMYGDAFLAEHVRAERGDRATLDAVLSKWKVRWTLLLPGDGAVEVLDHEPGWRRLYADRYAVVHVRTDVPGP
jgi:hypothetical protein